MTAPMPERLVTALEVNPAEDYDAWQAANDGQAPYRCPRCHGTNLECWRSQQHQTSVRCPACDVRYVVHDG